MHNSFHKANQALNTWTTSKADRNTFHHLSGDRYADKDYIYLIDFSEQGRQLRPLKSLHNP
ncbi:MAG: hypothetical protein J5888_06300 [Bacteroidaceae bacterium]|nr:hypothetical protein [Bacteroidaceae bacterium]